MSAELAITIRLLKKPRDVTCIHSYEVESYKVCITKDKYIVYDKIAEDPFVEKRLREIEELIKKLLLMEDKTPEEVLEEIPDEFKPIVRRQFYSYGLLDPLFLDPDIIDIHVVYRTDIGTFTQVIHRDYGRLTANIELTLDELREIILRMASLAGKVISESKPLHSFIEPIHEARVTVIYYSDVTMRREMSIDIRKQPKNPWTILKLIDLGTVTPEEAAFLWLAIKYRVPILVVGELMSGKTTLITAVINLVPPDSRVLTIEDAPEIKVYVPAWHRTTTRESEVMPISIFNILKVAMRISADYIVVGEIRGEEAREWAQAILLGHGGISSFHADSPEAAFVRLRTPPIEVNPQALEQISVIVKMIPLRTVSQRLIRRAEVYINEKGELARLFAYKPEEDRIELVDDPLRFSFVDRIVLAHGVPRDQLRREYETMIEVLRNVYNKWKQRNPSLEQPDYKTLPYMLYRRLELYQLGYKEEDIDRTINEIIQTVKETAPLYGIIEEKLQKPTLTPEREEVEEVNLDEIL